MDQPRVENKEAAVAVPAAVAATITRHIEETDDLLPEVRTTREPKGGLLVLQAVIHLEEAHQKRNVNVEYIY